MPGTKHDYARFYPISRGERAVWAAAFVQFGGGFNLSKSHAARSAVLASRVVLVLREVVRSGDFPREVQVGLVTEEEKFLAREMVNLEAALGQEYAHLLDRTNQEVGEEVGSTLMWLDHHGFREAAAALRKTLGVEFLEE